MAYFLLYNFIHSEMTVDPMEQRLDVNIERTCILKRTKNILGLWSLRLIGQAIGMNPLNKYELIFVICRSVLPCTDFIGVSLSMDLW